MAVRKSAPEARRKAGRCRRSWPTSTSIRWTRSGEQRGLSFGRYADDIAIFVSSARSAERVGASVIAWIEQHLKVEVNRDKSGSGPSGQSGLLGFRLYADGRIGVAPKAIERLKAGSYGRSAKA